MADESSSTTSEIAANAEVIQNAAAKTDASVDGMADSFDEATKSSKKFFDLVTRQMPRISKSMVDMKKKLDPVVKEMDSLSDSVKAASKNTSLLDKAIDRAMGGNQKQILASLLQFRKYGNAIKDAANQSVELANKMDEYTESAKAAGVRSDKLRSILDRVGSKYQQNKKQIADLEAQMKSGGDETGKLSEKIQQLEKSQLMLQKREGGMKTALELSEQQREISIKNLETHAQALGANQKKVQELRDSYIQTIKEERRLAAEQKIAAGGMQAFTGHIQKFKNEKFFEYLEKFQGTFLLAFGFKQIGDALQDTSAMMASTAGIARTLGKDAKTGMGDLWASAKQAQEATSGLMYTSGELGIAFEKVSEAGSRIRTSIRFDKEGQFSEKAITGMTRAAAEFSKVAGVDMDQSVGMIEKRIKQFGMTSEEAVADVNAMRISLQQMMVGVKSEVIAMDDMVRLIEEASDASKAYVVDTRLLTQALRGAATQAANLGDSQKQAKDVTQAIGKVFGDAPDFIKIPAGYDMLEQLTGGDTDGFLEKFDANTKKQLTAIRDSLKKGEIDKYTAARAIMDATAGTEAGQEATMKRLSKTILGSSAAAEIIAETYGIENRNTAFQLQKILKDTDKFQAALEKETGHKISFAAAMAKDVAVFDEMIGEMDKAGKSTADQIAKLQEKGLSASDADAYLKARKAGVAFEIDARKQIKALEGDNSAEGVKKRADLEKEIYKKTTLEQAALLDNALHPGKKLLNELRKAMPEKKLEIGTPLLAKELQKGGYKTAQDLAKAFGITNKDNIAALQKVYSSDQSITAEQLEDMRSMESEANKKQIESITATATKFNDGLLTGLKYVSISLLGDLGKWLHEKGILDSKYLNAFGPVTQAVLGLGAAIAGFYVIWKGAFALISRAVEAGVRAAGGVGGGNGADVDSNGKTKTKGGKGGKLGKFGRMKGLLKGAGGMGKALMGGAAIGTAISLYSDSDKIADAYKKKGLGSAALQTLPAILGGVGSVAGGVVGSLAGPLGTVGGGIGGGYAGDKLGQWIVDKVEGSSDTDKESTTTPALGSLGTASMNGSSGLAGQQLQMAQGNQGPNTAFAPQGMMGGAAMGAAAMMGGGQMAFPAMQATASQTSFNPSDGKLTLEVANWGDIMAAFKKASSSAGIFG